MTGLEVRLSDPTRGVDLDLVAPSGQTTALLGPNGSGKSTALLTAAGIHHPVHARVVLDGRDLTAEPPHRRRIALLSQEPLLLPHLTALDNVAFGPRTRGLGRRAAARTATEWLARVRADHLADRRPSQLSGGQAQRVAIARALAAEPDAVLLDEPLAALDVDAAPDIRQVLREVLADRTAIIVTHDVVDAVLLADHAVVLTDGAVVEEGPVTTLVAAPRSPFAARIAGVNLVEGTATDDGHLTTAGGALFAGLAARPVTKGDPVTATFRPDAVAVHTDPPGGSPRNVVPGTVTSLEPSGAAIRLRARTTLGPLVADLTPAAVAEMRIAVGDTVHLAVKAAAVQIRPA